MCLNRSKIVFLACILSVLAIAATSSGFLWASWALARNDEVDRLELLGQRIIARSTRAYDSAVDTLKKLETSDVARCSDAHIQAMRKAQADSLYVAGMGVFDGNFLQCSAWGRPDIRIPKVPPDFVTEDGVSVTLNLHPQMSGSASRINLTRGDYFVLVNPEVLLDSLTEPGNRIAVATESGSVLATHNDPDPQLLRSLIDDPRDGVDSRYVYAAVREEGLLAVAMRSRAYLYAPFKKYMLFLLPIFLAVASLLVGGIVWATIRRLSPLGELRAAVRRRDFIAHYQPIVDLRTGRCVGGEALVRWPREDGKLTPPGDFIPLAEQSGLVMPITDQVIDCVIRDLRPLLEADPLCHITINLAAEDVRTGRALDVIQEKLAPTGIQSRQIWLEMTESGFVEIDAARVTLQRAHQLGHRVAIDDFGTGYSSLRSLQDLPLDALKIDKSFVDTIGCETARSSITAVIIEMTRKLGLACIAEGVETQAQCGYLAAHGVDYGQGWLFSKPLSAEDFIAFHRREGETPALPA